ncbi:hypothetical protein [Flavobacterium sp. AG291]|uniref:hypothetical protein n=1 Tax=Flavobacterium sp. AG291 TaxID=2184000 RepID=UPI0011C0634C|nr:hypothetical protein [Flavobacterium sp. AG291]
MDIKKSFIIPNSITTETYYQGRKIDTEYFNNNEELFKNYPSKEEVHNQIDKIKSEMEDGETYILKISEKGIEIIKK